MKFAAVKNNEIHSGIILDLISFHDNSYLNNHNTLLIKSDSGAARVAALPHVSVQSFLFQFAVLRIKNYGPDVERIFNFTMN